MVKIEYARGVKKEVNDAIDFYESARDGLGREFLTELERAIENLATDPLRFRFIRKSFRRCLVNRFPYAIIFSYKVLMNKVYIVAVMHTSRKPEYWLSRTNKNE